MTQKILGSHSRIHTQAEPWILLNPLNSLNSRNITASYNHKVNVRGTRAFISSLPGGEEQYWSELGNSYSRLYASILARENKEIFLDKTPRYYLVAEDLRRMFPESVAICLLRNPMAVLNSIISTWTRRKLYTLCRFRQDLIEAPEIFGRLLSNPGDGSVFLRYEDLVQYPAEEIARVCDRIGVEFEPGMLDYKRETVFELGDRKSVDALDGPSSSFQDSWVPALADPQVWRLQNEYFELLGVDTFRRLGYDPASVLGILESNRPSTQSLKNTLSLDLLLDDQRDPLLGLHRLQRESEVMHRDLKRVTESIEYKVGRAVTWPLRLVRRGFVERGRG